jgi:hypothetical protein
MGGVLLAAALAAGCASSGVSRTDAMMSRLDELAKASADARTEIDKVTATMNAISEGGGADPRKDYEKFRGEVGAVASAHSRCESAGAGVRSAMESHFAAWEAEARQMKNEEIRAASLKRRDDARAKMSAIEPALAHLKTTFDSYLSNLRDIEKLLGADLSPGGVSAASKTIGNATDEGVRTKKGLQALEDGANRIREDLAVRAPPPPPQEQPAPEPAPEKGK